jgi:hypothetical protein
MADRRMKVTIVGRSPLLCNNPAKMGVSISGPKGAKQIPTPEEECKLGAYAVNGHFAFPGIGVRNSLVGAAGSWKVKMPGSSRKMSARSVVATVNVEPELIPILDPKTEKPLKKYAIDVRRAVVQRNGVMRARPRFEEWMLTFDFVYDDETLLPENVEQLIPILEDAGKRVGIGDYRPSKSGWFGRFEVRK